RWPRSNPPLPSPSSRQCPESLPVPQPAGSPSSSAWRAAPTAPGDTPHPPAPPVNAGAIARGTSHGIKAPPSSDRTRARVPSSSFSIGNSDALSLLCPSAAPSNSASGRSPSTATVWCGGFSQESPTTSL
ncbi:unnamed protein product, partial [Ascophyllum nodosum]